MAKMMEKYESLCWKILQHFEGEPLPEVLTALTIAVRDVISQAGGRKELIEEWLGVTERFLKRELLDEDEDG